jgi:putative ABC transport system substrate-binding protein
LRGTVCSVLLAFALGGQAQTTSKVARIGVLGSSPAPAWAETFRQALRDLGWIEGKNLVLDWRFTHGQEELHAEHATEFVRSKVNVIFAPLALQVEAARQATSTIPIVFCCHTDPVSAKHVESLARPGRNATGVAQFTFDTTTKRLEMLKKTLPNAVHVAVLRNPDLPEHTLAMPALQEAAKRLGVRLSTADARHADDLEAAYAAFKRARADAVLVLFSAATYPNRAKLAELQLKYQLPSAHLERDQAAAGALMSFGVSTTHIMQRSASFIDRILKGANPSALPVEQVTHYDFVINLKAAGALGVSVPQPVLLSATEIIR